MGAVGSAILVNTFYSLIGTANAVKNWFYRKKKMRTGAKIETVLARKKILKEYTMDVGGE